MNNGVVLIADPDATTCQGYELALARAGFSVVSATDGTSALRMATRLVPDDILTEILLPNLDGFTLARRLRRQPATRHVGIVAVTSYDGDDLMQRAAESGIDTVLRKTRSMADVVRAVATTTRNSRLLTSQSSALRARVDSEIDRSRRLRSEAEEVVAESRQVAADIARAIGAEDEQRASEQLLLEADGARDVLVVDRARGEQLFDMLSARYGDHAMLHYKRGEAYRAIGHRKLAHVEFTIAADRFPGGVWRDRAQFAAMRTRSHHEKPR